MREQVIAMAKKLNVIGLMNTQLAYQDDEEAKSSPTPITSPVERISGPKIGSTPKNLLNGNTASCRLRMRND
jgi:hypothetical protein